MNFKLGIIGAGVMANALITQFINKNILDARKITVYDIDINKSKQIEGNVHISENIKNLILNSEMILFAVKPQHYEEIVQSNNFTNEKIIISIMAGVKISTLRKRLKNDCGILRVMPNVPCKIGKGICALCFDKINNEKREFLLKLFASTGDIIEIEEEKFDAITSISGSGPAYVYMFIQGLIEGGIRGGLTYEESKHLAAATMIGGSELAKISEEPLNIMVDNVCSKGGTTIEAVNIYKEKNLVEIIAEGVVACYEKSRFLSEKL